MPIKIELPYNKINKNKIYEEIRDFATNVRLIVNDMIAIIVVF